MKETTMDLDAVTAEVQALILPRFDEGVALRLGVILTGLATGLPVVINIRAPHRTFFHVALPGSQSGNENWARRKSNMSFFTGMASMAVGLKHAASGRSLADSGLALADYADHGGAVPVVVLGVGMIAVATVSGLPQEEDHALVVRGIRALAAEL